MLRQLKKLNKDYSFLFDTRTWDYSISATVVNEIHGINVATEVLRKREGLEGLLKTIM